MKITEDVRKYAAKQGIKENEALESGMQQRRRRSLKKALRFTRMGSARVSPKRALKFPTYPIQTLWKRSFWIEKAGESILEKSSEIYADA